MSFRCPVSGPELQNYIHQTYASANLLLAMLWFVLFASCRGLESPIHFKRFCYCEDDWTGTQHKMPVGLSVHEFYTPQLQRPESSFFLYVFILRHIANFSETYCFI